MGSNSKITNRELLELLQKAISEFYQKDEELIALHGTERACVFRIGLYLNELLKESQETKFPNAAQITIDCEYNKSGFDPKKDINGNRIIPDLLLHQRGYNNNNLLVTEFKVYSNDSPEQKDSDVMKLRQLTRQDGGFAFHLGIWVNLGTALENVEYQYYINGEEVGKQDL